MEPIIIVRIIFEKHLKACQAKSLTESPCPGIHLEQLEKSDCFICMTGKNGLHYSGWGFQFPLVAHFSEAQ
jgi:hypothetical protein